MRRRLRGKGPAGWLAHLVSMAFDPLVVVPITVMAAVSYAYLNGYRWQVIGLIFGVDVVMPAAAFLYSRERKHWHDWDVFKREERFPLFIIAVICHLMGVLVTYLFQRHPLTELLLAFWVLAGLYTLITLYWKISIHTGVIATVATIITWKGGVQFAWVWGIVAAVAWARVVDRDHTWQQVVAGAVIPPVVMGMVGRLTGL